MSLSNGVIMIWLCASTCFSGAAALKSFEVNIAEHKQTPEEKDEACAICTTGTILQPDVVFEHNGHSYPCQEAQRRADHPGSLKKNKQLTCVQARTRWASTCCKGAPAPPEKNDKRLKATQPGPDDTKRVGAYEGSEAMNRGLSFMVRNAEQSENATILASTVTPHEVQVKLVNDGSRPVTFSKLKTPFDQTISYKVLRSIPATSTYLGSVTKEALSIVPKGSLITLSPREEVSTTIDINKLIGFHETGKYRVFVDFPVLIYNGFDPRLDALNAADATESIISSEFQINVQEGGVRPLPGPKWR